MGRFSFFIYLFFCLYVQGLYSVVLNIASGFKTVFAVFPVGPALPPQSKDVLRGAG